LADFEKVFIAAQVSSVLGRGDDQVGVLRSLLELHARSVHDWIVFTEEEHGWY